MLISLGVDFRKTSLEGRERLLDPFRQIDAIGVDGLDILEILSIHTCNRMELYCWSPRAEFDGAQAVFGDLAERWTESKCVRDEILLRGNTRSGDEVVRHLLRVASGLESQILGDIHVLGQLRRAYVDATERGTVGPHLHRLFDLALRTGKRIRRDTALMEGRRSVGSEAARLNLQRIGDLGRTPRIAVVGCGKIGSHAARALGDQDVHLVLLNRTSARARTLAEDIGCEAAPWGRLQEECRAADGIIVATGSDRFVLAPETFTPDGSWNVRRHVVVDLAVPRNVDPDVGRVAGVTLIDLDSLNPRIAEVEEARVAAVDDAEEIVDEEVPAFSAWLSARRAGEALAPLRSALMAVCEREVAFATDETAAARTASRIVAKLMASPMEEMRERMRTGQPVEPVADIMRSLFPEARA